MPRTQRSKFRPPLRSDEEKIKNSQPVEGGREVIEKAIENQTSHNRAFNTTTPGNKNFNR